MKPKFTFLLLFTAFTTFSQTTIIGNISSEEEPLLGANVIIKGTEKGAISDFDGNFELQVHQKDTLVVSYLGYDSKEIIVGDRKAVTVNLEGNIALDTVEIIAYGTTTKTYCSIICCPSVTSFCCSAKGEKIKDSKDVNTYEIEEKLYPNPSKTGRFQLKLIDDYKNVQIQIFNISGQLVKTIAGKPQNKILHIDLSENASGIYLININADGKHLTTKKAIID